MNGGSVEGKGLVEVAAFQDEMLARACVGMLVASGVECTTERIDPLGLTPLLGFIPGIKLLVRPEDEAQARELIASIPHEGGPGGSRKAAEEGRRQAYAGPLPEEIADALARIQIRRRYMWVLYLGYVPVCGLFFLITRAGVMTLILAMVWAILTWVAGLWVASSRCPHCGRLCYQRHWTVNISLRNCSHCGFEIRPRKAGR